MQYNIIKKMRLNSFVYYYVRNNEY
jgi:hypothetical protein